MSHNLCSCSTLLDILCYYTVTTLVVILTNPLVPIPKQYPVAELYTDASQFFVVNRTLTEAGFGILAILHSGGHHLLHGPRQASKTTTILQCIKSLPTSEFQTI